MNKIKVKTIGNPEKCTSMLLTDVEIGIINQLFFNGNFLLGVQFRNHLYKPENSSMEYLYSLANKICTSALTNFANSNIHIKLDPSASLSNYRSDTLKGHMCTLGLRMYPDLSNEYSPVSDKRFYPYTPKDSFPSKNINHNKTLLLL